MSENSDKTALLERLLGERILILDGAMGTMIQALQARTRPTIAARRRAGCTITRTTSRATTTCWCSRSPKSCARSTTRFSRPAPTSSRPTRSTRRAIAQADYELRSTACARSTSRRRGSRANAPTRGPRRRPTSRASSPARSGRPIERRRSRPTSTIRASATSASTSWSRRTAKRSTGWSKAASTCCWSRRSSTRSTPRRRCSRIDAYFEEHGDAAADHRLGHDHRCVGPHAVRADDRRRSGTRCGTRGRSRSASTARSARR